MKTRTERKRPSEEEIAAARRERWSSNLERLREAHALAKEAFGTDSPTVEMTVGVAQILEGGIERDLAAPVVGRAIELADGFSSADPAFVLAVADVLLGDDEAEAHLAEAAAEATRLFPGAPRCEAAIDVYYQVYGEDEEDEG